MIQFAVLDAVHAHPFEVETTMVATPPVASNCWLLARVAVKVHVAAEVMVRKKPGVVTNSPTSALSR